MIAQAWLSMLQDKAYSKLHAWSSHAGWTKLGNCLNAAAATCLNQNHKIYGWTKTGRVGQFQAAKMVLGPKQTAHLSPAGSKCCPRTIFARTKIALTANLSVRSFTT